MSERNVPADLPFAPEEYAARQARVRAELERRGIDALYVTSPANVLYLTGYDASWYPPRLPVGVAVHRDEPDLVFFDWTRHADYVRLRALYDDVVLFDYVDAAPTAASALARRGWTRGTVGVEWHTPTPVAAVLNGLAEELRRAGAEVVDGEWAVDGIRLRKSPAEVTRVRHAAAMADAAFAALWSELRPGMTELEVAARISSLLAEAGSEIAAQPALVSSGPSAWCDTHAFPSARRLETGDVVAIDACAVVDRYHVNLCRTFALGRARERARELLETAAAGSEVLVRDARAGEGPEIAAAAAERRIRASVPDHNIWWIGGYALGLALPPSWVGHAYLANDGPQRITWQPGYLSNWETILYDRDEGFEAAAIDTVLMAEGGLEVLSELPRTLLDVP